MPPSAVRKDLLQLLPDELLFIILTACTLPTTLLRIPITSLRLCRLCHRFDESLWKAICLVRFPRLQAAVEATARCDFSFRDLYLRELATELAPPKIVQPPALPMVQQVLEQFVISMELHISATKISGMTFVPEPTPSQETPGIIARWTGRLDELSEQRFWSPDAMPSWLREDATCDTFSRVQLVVYLTWLHEAPRTLKIYHGEYSGGNDDGLSLHHERLGCGPDECDGSLVNGEFKPDLQREAEMGAALAERDGHVELQFGYSVFDGEDGLLVEGHEQRARFMAMHFPCLLWPPLPKRRRRHVAEESEA